MVAYCLVFMDYVIHCFLCWTTTKTTAQLQREDFAGQLSRELDIRSLSAEDWGDLFWQLAQFSWKGKVLVVLDEINWMGSKDPTFLAKLKSA